MTHYGLLWHPLGHSLSPKLHQALYQELGIQANYDLVDVEEKQIPDLLERLRDQDGAGLNVTIPYKEAVIPYLDELSPVALAIGAVNTLVARSGRLYGSNTDYDGIRLTFQEKGWSLVGRSAVILGTGGAALALEHFLVQAGVAQLTFVSRSPQGNFKGHPVIGYAEVDQIKADYLVNATPVGLFPQVEACPLFPKQIARFDRIFDLIYNPSQTQLLALAQDMGKDTTNGLPMLIGQAIQAIALWQNLTFTPEECKHLYQVVSQQFL